jgi:hypothetical protein
MLGDILLVMLIAVGGGALFIVAFSIAEWIMNFFSWTRRL